MYNDLVPEYNSRIDSIATQSQQAASVLDEPACTHCLAPYGHKINCPLINREAAEQRSVQLLADIIRMRALGVLY